jgi:hypothetical protein
MVRPAHLRLILSLGLAVCLTLGTVAFGQETNTKAKKKPATEQATEQIVAQPASAVPPPEVLLMLVRNTVVALNQANFTGNYTVLRDLGSPSLQVTSAAELGIAFANLRQQGVDLSPALVLTPTLSESPAIGSDGVLRLAGHFPTKPLQINFLMTFQPVAGIWRLHGLSVNTVQAQ